MYVYIHADSLCLSLGYPWFKSFKMQEHWENTLPYTSPYNKMTTFQRDRIKPCPPKKAGNWKQFGSVLLFFSVFALFARCTVLFFFVVVLVLSFLIFIFFSILISWRHLEHLAIGLITQTASLLRHRLRQDFSASSGVWSSHLGIMANVVNPMP